MWQKWSESGQWVPGGYGWGILGSGVSLECGTYKVIIIFFVTIAEINNQGKISFHIKFYFHFFESTCLFWCLGISFSEGKVTGRAAGCLLLIQVERL